MRLSAHTLSQQFDLGNESSSEERVNVLVNGVALNLNALDSLFSIEELFGFRQMRFISNGRLLSPASSLKSNGVKNGDSILALYPENQIKPKTHQNPTDDRLNDQQSNFNSFASQQNLQKKFSLDKLKERFEKNWSDKFTDPEAIYEQLRDATDPRTASESARLSDLFKMRVESSYSAYRKVCNKFSEDSISQNIGSLQRRQRRQITIIPEKPMAPSTEALPELWIHDASRPNNRTV
ncbi:hypothetical protein TRFO_43209 [Tritrichomonas foetus]|uniref:Ubiquitin-like domain-containing protein n=1 Tax=Tritrichomonas foetus TaxID=1144522 RepID=A0A1J4KWM6_9EUKA|nr:hypothetical protein TRFO_43209 [Tritrichomonas foetus]|eukprot:OHT13941.1 hypothetical protein TRFO_43209 [Tritrichomonas foetus]